MKGRTPFVFQEAYFHKIKDRETFIRSYNNLNTIENNVGVTERFIN
jgi:hypothetical protein